MMCKFSSNETQHSELVTMRKSIYLEIRKSFRYYRGRERKQASIPSIAIRNAIGLHDAN